MFNQSGMTPFTVAMPRRRPAAVVTLAVMAALVALSADATAKPTRAAPPTEVKAPRVADEPIMAIVSIKSQQVTFYDADGWILRAPVSTGVKGRETPAGVFAVIEKDKDHHSTMYDDAWMPNMQRITWNGLALHGGPLPGYAASHGCVRMPYGLAEEMFDKTRIGMRVIISPNDAAPVEFSHPSLFVPSAEAIAAAPAHAETLGREAADAAEVADQAKQAAATAAREAASLTASVRKLDRLKTGAAAKLASADKAIAAADQAKASAEGLKGKAAAKSAQLAAQIDAAKTDAMLKLDAAAVAKNAATDDAAKKAAAEAAGEAASLVALVHKLELQKTPADAKLASVNKAIAAADKAKARAEDLKQKAATEGAELAKQLDTAKIDAKLKLDAAAAAKVATEEVNAKKASAAKAATEAKLKLEPVSVYISRATQKIYVRRDTHKPWPDGGEVFDASIEAPVAIRDPEMPIGTHIFTAVAQDNGTLRWTAVTIDDADNAKDALDRVTIPQDVLDRIAPTALPRSSIIISDEPLSQETNYRTEFVAVLSDYPQGGFITRQPSTDVAKAQDGFGFFSLFGRDSSNTRRARRDNWQQPRWW
jgi:hypothetical protein